MRNPNKEEIKLLNEAAHAVARAELVAQSAQQATAALITKRDSLLMSIAEACGVPPGQPLDLGRRCWLEAPLQQGSTPLEVSEGEDDGVS